MTREEFKAKVSMALGSMERETWEDFLEAVWQLHLEASNHWIPVEERLPEFVYPIGAEVKNTSDYVLVYNGYTMHISRLVGGEIHWWEDNSELAPTHWMPIVPPRKEDKIKLTYTNN